MGAFELFVNANLGIRKPLITDVGHPSESAKAAGIIGSPYIDSDSNKLYEKTGENNIDDWVFLRVLGDSLYEETLDLKSDVSSLAFKDFDVTSDISSLQFKDIDTDSDLSSLAFKDVDVDRSL